MGIRVAQTLNRGKKVIMGSRKFDAALNTALSRSDEESGNAVYDVTVRMAAPLDADQADKALQLGVKADTRKSIVTCRLPAGALEAVAELPFVSRISLSQHLRPISREAAGAAASSVGKMRQRYR